ncbi:transglutaminaseTgpA domain-containing protein [Microbacterium hominis]|uniref:Transglutaminase domain-containing protein n=1 Tax=Microbacterium hominis TaxID=162426 RepID=A0A7D4PTC7_9MICO|nr:DUF3488 and transglutaminase-like domain-containing protein [Microbacterium hominis]QKJ18753.1 transglutaminase domain-containing protein [Microbacterium hominis]
MSSADTGTIRVRAGDAAPGPGRLARGAGARSGRPARGARRSGQLMLAIGVFAAMASTLLPLVRVIEPGVWLLGAVVLVAAILVTGYIARSFRLPAVAVSLLETAVWVVFVTIVFLRETALLGILPTPDTVRAVPGMIESAMNDIVTGVAPLEAGADLGLMIVGAVGILTIIIDHVVITARMPMLAAVALVAVSLIPAIAVPLEPDVPAFVLLAASILFLVRAETASRETDAETEVERDEPAPRPSGVAATALGIGAVGVVVALALTPALPQPVIRAGSSEFGTGIGLDATLQLGSDLRRPREVEIMLVRSSAPVPQYLRAATLSAFDGEIWRPDEPRTVQLDGLADIARVGVDDDIPFVDYTTSVQITNLVSEYLPVTYPAVGVEGLDGQWAAAPYNRTVLSQGGGTQGQTYEVMTQVPRPSLEQIRQSDAALSDPLNDSTQLPGDLPPVIAELAATVTAEATTDYDRAIALQRWFRSNQFEYSLEAPVDDGFDGSGAEAIAQFLDVREGYCIHFAAAFALMARTLEMPSRIVVGYLPGVATATTVDAQTVYSVSTSRSHAWPEVYFDGIGWIGFEPTNSLGTPTAFSSAQTGPGGQQDPNSPTAGPTTGPTSTATLSPEQLEEQQAQGLGSGTDETTTAWPAIGAALAVLLVLSLPALLRELRRRRQLEQTRQGDVMAAWTLVQDAAVDLGIPVPASDSPRAFGSRLVGEYGAPAEAVSLLVESVERASYAPWGSQFWQGDAVAKAAEQVAAAVMAGESRARRLLALTVPRSLIIRPGSVYAATAHAGEHPVHVSRP